MIVACFGGLQSNTGIGLSIYGDIFIKSQFVVFDGSASPRLGVAPKSL
jgi:Eukaryotic aspartyl protease